MSKTIIDLCAWIEDVQKGIGQNYYGTYSIGSFKTEHFSEQSDIDLIIITKNPISPLDIKIVQILELSWSLSHPLEVHLLWKESLNCKSDEAPEFILSTLIGWQGVHLHGEVVIPPKASQSRTLKFNALKIISNLTKLKHKLNSDPKPLHDIYYAIQVLEEKIPWEQATSRKSIAKLVEPPSDWDLDTAKRTCLKLFATWRIPEKLNRKISDLATYH